LEEEFIKRKKMDKWTDGQSSPSWEKYKD
jgi:hypothetical protein